MEACTFDFDCFSDLHKDAYGFRPRGHRFYDADTTDAERQEIWDYTCEVMEQSMKDQEEQEKEDLETFKTLINRVIELGAETELEALKWMTQTDNFYNTQCVDSWVWGHGILFTPYGKEICEKLYDIVEYI